MRAETPTYKRRAPCSFHNALIVCKYDNDWSAFSNSVPGSAQQQFV